ncbi:MAG: SPASM domain-containing protein [Bacteriovoracaceae bacterium]|nr:SPASM domain-containing protein [Bacteriovoracaceae bacterium]
MKDPKIKICPLPFSQLSLHSSGKVTPCCWLYDYEVGNVKDSSLEEIWNSQKMQNLRSEFLDGNPITCRSSIDKAQCNFHQMDLDEYVTLERELPLPMLKLDLMLGGKCNLECIMCNNWRDPNGTFTEENFWSEARNKVFPYLKELEVYGGEPFIQEEVYKLIDEVSSLNQECSWMFTTNAHYKFNNKLKLALDKVKLKSISISIDSLEHTTFSNIRKKGNLDIVLETLDSFIDYNTSFPKEDQFLMVLNVVIQKDNWREVGNFIRFTKNKGLKLFFYLLNEPEHLQISEMDKSEINEVIKFWLKENEELKDIRLLNLTRQLMKLLPVDQTIDFQIDFAKSWSETLEQIRYFKNKA